MEFEWDIKKALSNYKKHNLQFEDAAQVFLDPKKLIIEDKRKDYGEPRFAIIGQIEEEMITLIFTIRHEKIRIISARRASYHERKKYYQLHLKSSQSPET